MHIALWVVQIALAVLYLSGGAYKTFMFDELARQFTALPRAGWAALGVLEMAGAVLLVVPAALKWMPWVTPLAAGVLTVETLLLAGLYASYSVDLRAENPMVWAVVMVVLVAVVAWGRSAHTPVTGT